MAVPAGAATTYTVDDDWQIGIAPYEEDTDGDTDFATIQAAVNAATDGDTIIMAAGNYTENVTINVRITVQGAGSASTIITSPGGPVFKVERSGDSSSDRVVIKDLQVTGATGSGNPGSGILFPYAGAGGSYTMIENVAAVQNQSIEPTHKLNKFC